MTKINSKQHITKKGVLKRNPKNKNLTKLQIKTIQSLDGTEIFFRELGVVTIDAKNMFLRKADWHEKITTNNYKEIIDAYNITEYGTSDFKKILEIEGF